jgi:hypothetical protein
VRDVGTSSGRDCGCHIDKRAHFCITHVEKGLGGSQVIHEALRSLDVARRLQVRQLALGKLALLGRRVTWRARCGMLEELSSARIVSCTKTNEFK